MVLWLVILIMGIVSLTLSVAKKISTQFIAFIGLIKLMINHCVIMAAVLSINYKWGHKMSHVLGWIELVAVALSKNIRFSCLLLGVAWTDLEPAKSVSKVTDLQPVSFG